MPRKIRTIKKSPRQGLGAGKGKGYKNIVGKDSAIHSQSSRGMKQPQWKIISSIDGFAENFEPQKNIVQANPNLPAFVMNPSLSESEINLLKRRLKSCGTS